MLYTKKFFADVVSELKEYSGRHAAGPKGEKWRTNNLSGEFAEKPRVLASHNQELFSATTTNFMVQEDGASL